MFFNKIRGRRPLADEKYLWELLALTEKYARFGLDFSDLTFVGYESKGKFHTGTCAQFRRHPTYISGKEVQDLMNSSNLCRECAERFTLVGGSLANNSFFQIDVEDAVGSFKDAFKIYDPNIPLKSFSKDLSVTKAATLLQMIKSNALDAEDIFTLFKGECDEKFLKEEASRIQDLFSETIQTARFQSKLAKALPKLGLRISAPVQESEGFMVIHRKASLSPAREVELSLLAWGMKRGDIAVIPNSALFYLGELQRLSESDSRSAFELPYRPDDEHLEFMNSVFNPGADEDLSLKEIYEMAKAI